MRPTGHTQSGDAAWLPPRPSAYVKRLARQWLPCSLAIWLFAGCLPAARPPVKRTFLAMGTVGSLSLPAAENARLDEACALLTGQLNELEARFSAFLPDSELSSLNRQPAAIPLPVSAEMQAILNMAEMAFHNSGGAFDVTVGPLMALWGFRGNTLPEHAPADEDIAAVLDTVGWQHVVLSNDTVQLLRPGLQLDLGALAKGYAVDCVCETLAEAGFTNALVNLGGNMRALGHAAAGRPWRIAVRHPMEPDSSLGTLTLTDKQAVATSGGYERFVILDGQHFAHIMDARTGRPAQAMAGVTAVAASAMLADVLSTALFILGTEDGRALLDNHPDCSALLVPAGQPLRILTSPTLPFQPIDRLRGHWQMWAPAEL